MTIARTCRRTIRRFGAPGAIRELTFSCYHQYPLIERADLYGDLARVIGRACARHGYELLCFVIMPDHVHLVVRALEGASGIAVLLQAIKRPTSYRGHLEIHRRDPRLSLHLTRFRGDRKPAFRLWQAGPGYDRNLVSSRSSRASIDYLHRNPVRKGLVGQAADWPWSSFRQFGGLPRLVDGLPEITLFEG
jgi:putative transposase